MSIRVSVRVKHVNYENRDGERHNTQNINGKLRDTMCNNLNKLILSSLTRSDRLILVLVSFIPTIVVVDTIISFMFCLVAFLKKDLHGYNILISWVVAELVDDKMRLTLSTLHRKFSAKNIAFSRSTIFPLKPKVTLLTKFYTPIEGTHWSDEMTASMRSGWRL